MLRNILNKIFWYVPWFGVGTILGFSDITIRTWQFYALIICIAWIYISGIKCGKE